jgi:hypothetical protein
MSKFGGREPLCGNGSRSGGEFGRDWMNAQRIVLIEIRSRGDVGSAGKCVRMPATIIALIN